MFLMLIFRRWLEVSDAVCKVWKTFTHAVKELNRLTLAYLHITEMKKLGFSTNYNRVLDKATPGRKIQSVSK